MTNFTREVELEVIQMLAYESLCKEIDVSCLTEVTPGRDVDDDGNVCSWYEDKYYPKFTKAKQKKLLNYILTTKEAPALIAHVAKLLLDAGKIDPQEVKRIIESGRVSYE